MFSGHLWQGEFSDAELVVNADTLSHSLYPSSGRFPSYLLSTTGGLLPYVKNHLGYLEKTVAGECLFWGARRVRNLLRSSNRFDNATHWTVANGATITAINDSGAVLPGELDQDCFSLTRAATTANSLLRAADAVSYTGQGLPIAFSIEARAGTLSTIELRVWDSAGIGTYIAQKIITLSSTEWTRISVSGTGLSGTTYRISLAAGDLSSGSTGNVYIRHAQLEEIIGDASMAPSEYVPTDDSPRGRFYSGSAVDGVQCFNTAKGNSVDSNGIVTEATGSAIADTTLKGVASIPQALMLVTNTNNLSAATLTNCTLPSATIAGPNARVSGLKQLESNDGASVSHYLSQPLTGTSTYDGKYLAVSVIVKYDSVAWQWLQLVDLDGTTTKIARFNVQTGAIGTVSSGTLEVETLVNGYYRFLWTVQLGSGGSDASIRLWLASSNTVSDYQGNGTKFNNVWLLNVTSASSASSSDKPIALPPVDNTTGSQDSVPGRTLVWALEGLLDYTNFAVVEDFAPYFIPQRTNKGVYGAVNYIRTSSPSPVNATFGSRDFDRTGLSIRPNNGGGDARNRKGAWDGYVGELNPLFRWATRKLEGGTVQLGEWIIPNDTTPDNANSRLVYQCVVSGTLGNTEPTYDATYVAVPDTVTNLTSENAPGTAKYQANEDNGAGSMWEPYFGCHQDLQGSTFAETTRFSWFISDEDYGCAENGVAYVKQTAAVNNKIGPAVVLRYKPAVLSIGTLGAKVTVDGANQYASTVISAMPPYMTFHKNLKVINRKITADENTKLSIM